MTKNGPVNEYLFIKRPATVLLNFHLMASLYWSCSGSVAKVSTLGFEVVQKWSFLKSDKITRRYHLIYYSFLSAMRPSLRYMSKRYWPCCCASSSDSVFPLVFIVCPWLLTLGSKFLCMTSRVIKLYWPIHFHYSSFTLSWKSKNDPQWPIFLDHLKS